jgi:hypothetical protein
VATSEAKIMSGSPTNLEVLISKTDSKRSPNSVANRADYAGLNPLLIGIGGACTF